MLEVPLADKTTLLSSSVSVNSAMLGAALPSSEADVSTKGECEDTVTMLHASTTAGSSCHNSTVVGASHLP